MPPRPLRPPKTRRRALHILFRVLVTFFFVSFSSLLYFSVRQRGWSPTDGFYSYYEHWTITTDPVDLSKLPGARKVTLGSLKSSWHCTSENDLDRYNESRICFIKNLCVNRMYGAFMVGFTDESKPQFPETGMLSVWEPEDVPWKPITRPARSDMDAYYLEEKIFVYGVYVPSHYAHWFYNGFMPVYSTMREYNRTSHSWLLRATTNNYVPELDPPLRFETDYITKGYEIVQSSADIAGASQIRAPRELVCFAEAIVGTGGRASRPEAPTSVASHDYQAYAEQVHSFYNTSNMVQYIGTPYDSLDPIGNQNMAAHRAKDACLHSAKIHNPNSNRPIVVIIQRQKSRRVINFSELADHLAKVHNFTVREIYFDKGCSISHTAAVVYGADVLITPHGSQLASAVFMPHATSVVTIDGPWYAEEWFDWPMVAMSRRFYHWTCDQGECLVPDSDLIRSKIEEFGEEKPQLTPEEIIILANGSPGDPTVEALVSSHPKINNLWGSYRKDVSRKIADIPKFGRFVRWLIDDTMAERKAATMEGQHEINFVNLCERKGCCGPVCSPIGQLLYGSRSAFGLLKNDSRAAEEAGKKIPPWVWEDKEST